MKKVQVMPLTLEEFAPFGQFYAMDKPQGYALCGEIHQFFADRLVADSEHRVGYSTLVVRRPESMVIKQQEYHTTTWEMIMPLDDDMILHVAPPSGGVPVTDHVRAFLVPKNTLIKLHAATWHLAPLPASKEQVTTLIILPERT